MNRFQYILLDSFSQAIPFVRLLLSLLKTPPGAVSRERPKREKRAGFTALNGCVENSRELLFGDRGGLLKGRFGVAQQLASLLKLFRA